MFYVVCTYIVVCLMTAILMPAYIPDHQKKKVKSIEKEKKHPCDDDDIDKMVEELLKDV